MFLLFFDQIKKIMKKLRGKYLERIFNQPLKIEPDPVSTFKV
jgi:hypothetical protein